MRKTPTMRPRGREPRTRRLHMPGSAHDLCAKWNERNEVGSQVTVKRGSGEVQRTTTRTEAWVCEEGYPVICLNGIPGYYPLARVQAVEGD
jgi:poly(3-hydroxybutyrate) depolymerase